MHDDTDKKSLYYQSILAMPTPMYLCIFSVHSRFSGHIANNIIMSVHSQGFVPLYSTFLLMGL